MPQSLRLVHELPAYERVPHATRNFEAEERRVLALAAKCGALDLPPRRRVEDAHVARASHGQRAPASHELRRLARDLRDRRSERHAMLVSPLERERQQELEPRRTGLGFAER